jgi:hypothetical protein
MHVFLVFLLIIYTQGLIPKMEKATVFCDRVLGSVTFEVIFPILFCR